MRLRMGQAEIPIMNTAFSSLLAMLILVVLAALISRGLSRRGEEERIRSPRGWQNLAEWALEYVINLLEGAAGKRRLKKRPLGRTIFPLVGTLFIFIIFANWFSLSPLFSTLLVKPPFLPVEPGAVSVRAVNVTSICPGDTVTFHATVERATEPHYDWYLNGELQEEHGAYLDYQAEGTGFAHLRLGVWNEDESALRHSTAVDQAVQVLYGEEAVRAGCGERERPPVQAAEHEEEKHEPFGRVWLFGKDDPGEATPLLRAPNSHLAVTAGMAIIAIITVQGLAIFAHGPVGYLKHLATDAPIWMRFIMFPIHVISEFSRIISLSARLFGNLYGGDVLLAVIFNLVGFLLPGIFFGIEAFFYYIQALLFSMLTTVYISLAVAGGHAEERAHGT